MKFTLPQSLRAWNCKTRSIMVAGCAVRVLYGLLGLGALRHGEAPLSGGKAYWQPNVTYCGPGSDLLSTSPGAPGASLRSRGTLARRALRDHRWDAPQRPVVAAARRCRAPRRAASPRALRRRELPEHGRC